MKERKLITLSREIIEDLDRKLKEDPDFNFSAWVEGKYIEEEMTEKGLKVHQKYHEKMARKYRNLAHYSSKKRAKLAEKLSEKHKIHLLSSKKIITKNAEYFDGQLKVWNNTFPDFRITALQFKELLGFEE